MKKFIHIIGEYKYQVGIYFMAAIMLNVIVGYFLGKTALEFELIWQMLLTAGVFAGMHYIYISELFHKITAPLKITIHFLLSYGILFLFSLLFHWFDVLNPSVLWQFTWIFIVFYIIIFLSFYAYYQNEGILMNKKLNEYKEKNKG